VNLRRRTVKTKPTSWRTTTLVLVFAALALVAAACGDDSSGASGNAKDSSPTSAQANDLDSLVAAAKKEGKVTIYTDYAQAAIDQVAADFEKKYPGIDVEVHRDIHPNLAPAAETELQTGQGVADVFETADPLWFSQQGKLGSFLPVKGPELTGAGEYDAKSFVDHDNFFQTGGAVNVYAWNTDEWPNGLTDDYKEFLDPALKGKIGLPEPSSSVYVDYYLWLEDRMGDDFLTKLAKQEPRIYQGATPLNEALVSGEISVTPYAFPPIAKPSKDKGAPIDYKLPSGGFWGAPHRAGILKTAPHPNAGFLLANYLVSLEGQKVLNADQSSVIKGAGYAYNKDMDPPHKISADDVTSFQQKFKELFTS
jgi:iron(III) transport system substrate-binding protein